MLLCAPPTARQIHNSVPIDGHVPTIGVALVLSRLDYGNKRADRSSDTPGTSPPVGAERSRLIDYFVDFVALIITDARTGHLIALAARPERVVYKFAVL